MSDRMPQRGLQCMSDRMSKLGITRRQQFDSLTSCGASRCNCAGRATCTSWYDLLTNLFFPPEEPSMVSWAKGCSSVIASCLSTVSKRFSNVEVPVADSKSAICKSSTTCQAVPVKAAMTFKAAIQLGTLFVASCFVRKLRDTFVGFSSIWFRWRTQGGCHSPELVQNLSRASGNRYQQQDVGHEVHTHVGHFVSLTLEKPYSMPGNFYVSSVYQALHDKHVIWHFSWSCWN